ncbi:MAG: hypothetical protein CMH30_06535 [Micavibrio sp.]|nr:hypothetical protein [Micavibrio sp.]|tara:strand:- start:3462 stop:4223 length:762 start_codon:yes stop_codon:yes gene_type:complete
MNNESSINKNHQKEPSDYYFKNKRNLAIFSGLLIAAEILPLTDNEQNSLFPFKLGSLDDLPIILLVIVLYNAFQLLVAWSAQYESVRLHLLNRIDAFIITSLAGASILIFIYHSQPHEMWLKSLLYLAIFIYFLLQGGLFLIRPYFINDVLSGIQLEKDKELFDIITSKEWTLVYSPLQDQKKDIIFDKSGNISKGKNSNENTWQIRNNLLELLNEEKKVFSRFRYNSNKKLFEHTNDSDTLSIENQTIKPKN